MDGHATVTRGRDNNSYSQTKERSIEEVKKKKRKKKGKIK